MKRSEKLAGRLYTCGVLNCGDGDCVHELTDEKCPHCRHLMVRVKTTGHMFCSNPYPLDVCDYEKSTGDGFKGCTCAYVGANCDFCKKQSGADGGLLLKLTRNEVALSAFIREQHPRLALVCRDLKHKHTEHARQWYRHLENMEIATT